MQTNLKTWTGLSWGVLIFTLLVCAWTFSHAAPFFTRTVTGSYKTMAIVGCLAAEAFVLWATHRHLRYAGRTGDAAREATLVMLGVIFLNVIVANLSAGVAIRNENILLQLYAKYVAVIGFAVTIVWGSLHMLRHDQEQRRADAEAIKVSVGTDLELSIQEEVARRVNTKLTSTEIQDAIDAAATAEAVRAVERILGQPVKRNELPASPPQPVIEARPVAAIDEKSHSAQYVNGAIKGEDLPKIQRRQE